MVFPIDTAAAIRDMENAGVEHRQTEAIVTTIVRAQDRLGNKADSAAVSPDLAAVESRLNERMEALESRMVAGLADLRTDGATDVVKVVLTVVTVTGLLFAALKLLG